MKKNTSDLSVFPSSAQPLARHDIDQAELEMELEQVIAQAYQASRSASTRRRYVSLWRQFQQFCVQLNACPLPADVDTIVKFLAWYGTTRVTSTLRSAHAAIRHHHAEMGHVDLTTQPAVTRFLAGHERLTGRPPKQKRPLLTDEVRKLSQFLDEEGGAAAVRDRAAILFGFACALRASEVVAATWRDCPILNRGMTLIIPRSKTDQAGRGQDVSAVRTTNLATCPVAALEEWRKLLQEHGAYVDDGPIFPTLHTSGEHACREYRIGNAALSTNAFRAMLKRRCAAIGIDPREIGGHSLRAGHATQAAENGVDILEIAQQGRWRDLRKVQVYVRSGRRFSFNSSGKIGL